MTAEIVDPANNPNGGTGMYGGEGSYESYGYYRYGFNGKENDNDVKGTGNQQDYGMRIYDPRLSKFLSVDPLLDKYPELTPYQFANNSPIANIDLDGEENLYYSVKFNEQGKSVLKLVLEEKTLLNLFPSYYFSYGGNSYYQTDEISWLNGGMGMKMLSKFEGKTKEELDVMLSAMKTDVEVQEDYVKQHEQEMKELFQNAFLGAAAVNTKKGTYTSTATDKQQQAANNKTSSEGNKNSTTGQISASGNKTNSVKTTPTVDYYANARKANTGSGYSADHIPSFASVKALREQALGRQLWLHEAAALKNQTLTLTIQTNLHRSTSLTYGGRNSKARILEDSKDPLKAITENVNAYRPALRSEGYTDSEIDATIKKLAVPFQSN
jgi:RHS repeat-associated protein